MAYPELGDWNSKQPTEAQADAVELAELMAWSAIEQLTGGLVAFEPIVVRPIVAEADGGVKLQGPVGGIQRVRIDGRSFSGYRLEGDSIYRLDGQAWTVMNDDLGATPTADGVFEVTYFRGWRPGRLLIWAAAELASEFYAAAAGDQKCRLPKGTRTVARQGVTFEIGKPVFASGETGIREVDVVLQRYNPELQRSQAIVASVETIARAPRRF